MDALQFSILLLGFAGWGFAGFTFGRVQRKIRNDREIKANLARALSRTQSRRQAVRFGVGLSDSLADTDDNDGHDDHDHDISLGRRAIRRPVDRHRAGRYAAGRDTRSADETALVLAGYDC